MANEKRYKNNTHTNDEMNSDYERNSNNRKKNYHKTKKKKGKLIPIIVIELIVLIILFGSYQLYKYLKENKHAIASNLGGIIQTDEGKGDNKEGSKTPEVKLTPEEQAAIEEQERLVKEAKEREELIKQADHLALSYDYEGAIELIKSYVGTEGGYSVYIQLSNALTRLEAEKASLVLYGGSYESITQINHIFFHSLIADNSKAFDGDYDAVGYNMYMTTVTEFKNIIQKMYNDGYVLINMADIARPETQEDGTTKYVANEIYLKPGKKPFVISVDDVSYYEYMEGDGFATRIIIGEDGRPTCEMLLDDGTTVTGDFDVVPILDAFVEEHPDFSYKGAKALLAITGYEGVLGYRTDDPASPTYEADKEAAKKVAEALKADGWEFGSHSWGHKNMQTQSYEWLKKDTDRWLAEVAPILGPTDILVFPFGVDIETTLGHYSSDKFKYLKQNGFNMYLGVFKEPWMHIKSDYIRMTRRPLDGQAFLEFPDRLTDLFDVNEIIDPERPAKNW